MPPSTSGWFENVYEDSEFDMKKHQPYFRDCSQELRQKLPMQPIEVTIEAGATLSPTDFKATVYTHTHYHVYLLL